MIKWFDKYISEDELLNKISYRLPEYVGSREVAEWLVKGIKGVALSKEEKTFKITYHPYTIMSLGLVEGDTQVRFVKAKDIVDAQDQLLNTCTCTIENIEEVK